MGPCPCGRCCVSPHGTWPVVFGCTKHTHTKTAFNQSCSQYCENRGKMWPVITKFRDTNSSSLMVSKQASHTRTGNSKPMIGNVERLELHFPHTALPHFLQWCCTKGKNTHILARLRESQLPRTQFRLSYLSEPQGLSVPHLLDVPEERLLTLLTRVAV